MKKWLLMLALALLLCAAAVPALAQDATPEATINAAALPDPVRSIYAALTAQAGLRVTPVTVEQIEFPDGCLGAPSANEMCAMMITEGYRATFDSPYGPFEIRTSLTGDNFRFAAPLALPANTLPAVRFQYSGGIAGVCYRLIIGPDGSYAALNCRRVGVMATGTLSEPFKSEFLAAVAQYGDFDWASALKPNVSDQFSARYSFHGAGEGAADDRAAASIGAALTTLINALSMPSVVTPEAPAAVALPDTARAVYDQLIALPGLSADVVTPVSVAQVEFPDGCLGVHLPDEMCTEAIIEGYRTLFDTPYGTFELRTPLTGDNFRFAAPLPLPTNTLPAILYKLSGGIVGVCNRLVIGPDSRYALSSCRGAATVISVGALPDEYQSVLADALATYAPFKWPMTIVLPAPDQFVSSMIFNGTGTEKLDEQAAAALDSQLMSLVHDPALAADEFAACSATPQPTPCPPASS